MEENRHYDPAAPAMYEEQNDDIDIMAMVRTLLGQWKKLLLWAGIAAVVGIVVAFSIPRQYTVSSKMAPEIVTKTSGSVASIASMLGANISNMTTNDAVYPDLYPEIVASTPFVTELFSMPVSIETKKEGKLDMDLYTYLKDYNKSPWWNAVFNAPFKALGWFMGLFREKQEEVEGYAALDASALTREQTLIAKAIRKSVVVTVDKKTQVISLDVTAQNPRVAKDLSDLVIDKIQRYVTSYRTEKARKDMDYYLQLYDEAKADYYAAQQRYANYVDANQGVFLQRVKTEQERLQNEMKLAFDLYNSCAQQLQMSRAKVQQETPVCVIVEPPVLPIKATKPSKMKTLAVFIFLGLCACAVWILWGKEAIAKFKAPVSEQAAAPEIQQSEQ